MRGPSRRGGALSPASRSVLWWACAVALALAVLLQSRDAEAYPWMVRHGYTNCGACHADPSGGELLTTYGHAISWEVLSTRYGGSKESSAAAERRIARAVAEAAGVKNAPKRKPKAKAAAEEEVDLDEESEEDEGAADEDESADEASAETEDTATEAPAEEPDPFEGMSGITGPFLGLVPANEKLLLGGSLRFASIYKLDAEDDPFRFFPMQLDLYGQLRIGKSLRVAASAGAVKVPAGSLHGRPAQVTANQEDGYNLISRTHWVGWDFGEGRHLLRAGRINLPFGIRMAEHVMWVRDRTQTDRESDQQHGLALYMGFESVRFEIMLIAGNYQINPDAFRERGFSGFIEFATSPQFSFGASSLYTYAEDDRLEPSGLATMRQAHGPMLRWAPTEALAILAEADVLLRSRRDLGYVGFLQVDLEPVKGLHFIGTGELLDSGYPDRFRVTSPPTPRSAGLGRPLPGAWLSLQWFFLPHFDLRVDAIIRQEKQILSQLHVYL